MFLCACAIVLAGLVSNTANAQPAAPLWVGFSAGYGFTNHNINGLSCDQGCPDFFGGAGGGMVFGADATWNAWERFGFSASAHYFFSALTMTATTSNVNVVDQNNNVVPLVRDYTMIVRTPEAQLDLSAFYRIKRLKLYAGFAGGVVVNPTWSSSVHIASPGNIEYGNHTSDTTFFPQSPLTGAQRNQFYISTGVSYDFPIHPRFMISPELRAYIPLTTLNAIYPWKETIVEFGASIKYGINIPELTTPSQENSSAAVEPPAPLEPAPPLVARLSTNAVYADGTREPVANIRVQVQFVTEAFPLLPFVFFDLQSAAIPDRYNLLARAEDFSSDAVRPNPVALHHSMMNIIAERLRAHPSATITIIGHADPSTENSDCELAAKRAIAVREYFTNIWRIDAARIRLRSPRGTSCAPELLTLTKTEDGFSENRRVEIETDDPEIVKPVTRKRFLETALLSPPAIEQDPAGSTTTGIIDWQFSLEHHGEKLFSDSGAGAPLAVLHALDETSALKMHGNEPMISKFLLTDKSGRCSAASDTLMVHKDTLNTEIERLSLTLFGTSLALINMDNVNTIRNFLNDFNPNDSASINGYTDKLGDTLFNEELSVHRAHNVDSVFHAIVSDAKHVGNKGMAHRQFPPGIHSYDTPEERFLARSVQIELRKKRKQ